MNADTDRPALPADNPFAAPSPLPHGLPPFADIQPAHFMPAITAGLAAQRQEWEAIAIDPGPPTLANTVEALERSGQLLSRVLTVHWTLSSSVIDEVVTARDAEIAPLLSAHNDALYLDTRIFARLDDLHGRRDELGLDPEQRRLLERTHLDFVRAGAALDEAGRDRLRELNAALAVEGAEFRRVQVAGMAAGALHVTDADELDGLSPDALASCAKAATRRDLDGWLVPLVLPSGQPHLATLTNRETRRRLHEASVQRGLGGAHDTRPIITRIVALRAERAALLGFADHASYVVADQTAGSVNNVMDMLSGLVGPAVANAQVEAAELEALLRADGHDGPLRAWDWAFYAERVRRERFGVDPEALRPYFPFDGVLFDGVFAAAEGLFGVTFTEREDLPAHHPDARVFEVFEADGGSLGLCVIDPYARDSKRGGAWMTTLSDQSHLLGATPVVTVTLNIPEPADGPALLTMDEVTTTFHEFGHALHGLFSDVTYPRFSGTSVPRDFVEFPSQVNELWAQDPDILTRYARHHETGEPLDPGVVAKLKAAEKYGQGFGTTEYLAASLLDLAWHRVPAGGTVAPEDVEAFEQKALADAGIDLPAVPPRYRTAYFAHVFAGGYSAGYYSYIWAEVLDAELVEWFGEQGGLTRENGAVLRDRLLARGGSVDPMAAFEAVRGRPPTLQPLLTRRGLMT